MNYCKSDNHNKAVLPDLVVFSQFGREKGHLVGEIFVWDLVAVLVGRKNLLINIEKLIEI